MQKTRISHSRNRDEYPTLGNLVGAWLNQDYDSISTDLDEVVVAYKRQQLPYASKMLIGDIRRYMDAHGDETQRQFTETFRAIFRPDIDFEGWKGRTTREFLLYVVRVLSDESVPALRMR